MERRAALLVIAFQVLIQIVWTTSQNGSLPEFEAVQGSTAHLPCQVPQRPPSSGIKCIFWYKDDEVMSVYTVDARDEETHVPSDRLRSRARFDPSPPWPPLLRLEAVKEGDAGVYYCRVDYRWDRTYMYTVVLKVIVPPQKLVILNEHDEEINGMAGPYLEGQSVRLTCEAIGGKPSPQLSWWRGREEAVSGPTSSSHGQVRSGFSFIPRRSDLLSLLTCTSRNNNLTAPSTVSVQIDLYRKLFQLYGHHGVKPVDVVLSPQLSSLTAGRRVEVRCSSGGSRPPSRMSWFLDSEPLANHTDLLSVDGNRTTSVLSFWPSRGDHAKYLRCRAENFLLSGSALEDGWHLNITYVPQVSLSLRSSGSKQQQHFLEGDDVRFTCDVRANPAASEVGWLFEGRPLSTEDPEIVTSFRGLLIRRVRRKHRGRYQCYAKNAEGTGMSRVVNLRAMFAPVCRTELKTYSVTSSEMERVECQVDADPAQVEFRWSFSNAADRHYNVSFTSAGLRSVATYAPRAPRDYGTLYCWGKNAVGEQQMPCIFTIIPLGSPDPLRNCSATNVTSTSVTVTCLLQTPRTSEPLTYSLDVFGYRNGLKRHLASPAPRFVVEGLPPGEKFLFAAYAASQHGKSAPFNFDVITLEKPAPVEERVFLERNTDRNSGDSTWIGPSLLIAVALCCFLIFAGAALWTKLRGGPGCQKYTGIPSAISPNLAIPYTSESLQPE